LADDHDAPVAVAPGGRKGLSKPHQIGGIAFDKFCVVLGSTSAIPGTAESRSRD
jgi:hypothetical protein